MSDIRAECLHSVAVAYLRWWVLNRTAPLPLNYLAYRRALGLEY